MSSPHHELARVYDGHAEALYAFLLSFTGCEADARDLLQETFVKLAARPQALAGARNERAVLLKISYRVGLDWTRRRRTRAEREADFVDQPGTAQASLLDDPDTATFRAALGAALLDLPVEQRAVVSLKLWQDLTFQEIAVAMDVSTATAASRFRYALEKLRQSLRPIYEEIRR